MIYAFDGYELDTKLYELRLADERCRLQPQVFNLLAYLVEHRERVVSKQELLDRLWTGRIVCESSLTHCLMVARKSLGDSAREQRHIQTVHGRGYRFVGTVNERIDNSSTSEESTPSRTAPTPSSSQRSGSIPGCAESIERCGACGKDMDEEPDHTHLSGKELKQISVLRGGLIEAPALAKKLGPEAMDRLMETFLSLARNTIMRFEGTITQCLPDGFLALFGAPFAHEDHARRAVLAGLEFAQEIEKRRAVDSVLHELAVRMGLHTGPVLVGSLESEPGTLYTAVGETVELAICLHEHAPRDTLLVSGPTHALVDTEFRADLCDSVPPEIFGTTIQVYAIKAVVERNSGVPRRNVSVRSNFVGRDRELAILRERLEHVSYGEGHVISVVGEPGIGKSRLLREFRSGLRDASITYLEGQCLSYRNATPYAPLLSVFRQACGIADGDHHDVIVDKVARTLGGARDDHGDALSLFMWLFDESQHTRPSTEPDALVRRERIFARFFDVIQRIGRERSCVIVIEDLHWIDATSEAWLRSLVDRLTRLRVLLLVTHRPGYLPPWLERPAATQIELPCLSVEDSAKLIRSLLQRNALSGRVMSEVVAKGHGNPFFLEELTWALGGPGRSPATPAVPDTVQAVLAARIDRAGREDKQVLQTASVIGTQVPFSLLRTIGNYSEEALSHSLARLQAAELVHEEPGVGQRRHSFKHALTQEVAYGSMLASVRQELHRKAAEALEDGFPDVVDNQPELLAHHYAQAGLTERAADYSCRAGQRASERSANLEASKHLTRGLELLRSLPETPSRDEQEIRLLITLGPVLMACEGWATSEIESTYVRARALCLRQGSRRQRFAATWGLWVCYQQAGRLQAAQTLSQELLELAQDQSEHSMLLEAHHAAWTTGYSRGHFEAAHSLAERGLRVYSADAHSAHAFTYGGHDPAVCGAGASALSLWFLGYADQALRKANGGLTLARGLSHPFSVVHAEFHLAQLHQARREPRRVARHAEAMIALCADRGFSQHLASGRVLCGWAAAMLGRGKQGAAMIRQGLENYRATGAAANLSYYWSLLAQIEQTLGSFQEALGAIDRAVELADATGENTWCAELHRIRGEVLGSMSGDGRSAAERSMRKSLAVAVEQNAKTMELRTATILSRLLYGQGRIREALEVLLPIYEWFSEGFDTPDLTDAKRFCEVLSRQGALRTSQAES